MPGGWLWLVMLVLLVLVMVFFLGIGTGTAIDYSDVLQLAEAGNAAAENTVIKRIVLVGPDRLEGELTDMPAITSPAPKPIPSSIRKPASALMPFPTPRKFAAPSSPR